MDVRLPALRPDELAALRLRALFESRGYQLYRMGAFEDYDFYMQNKTFLMDDDIITFTAADGRLMALKPDVTLSIVKNTPAGAQRRVYYTENVFRRSRQTGDYREINQMGLEFIGGEGAGAEAEVLALAAQSLASVGNAALDLSHMELIEAMLAPFTEPETRELARIALRDKSPHLMFAAAKQARLDSAATQRLAAFVDVSGPFAEAMPKARALADGIAGAAKPLDELQQLFDAIQTQGIPTALRLDFSIVNDTDYYNGLMFQGFVEGVAHSVLFGGRYDNLLRRFEKPQGAIGFALYLDALGRTKSDLSGNGCAGAKDSELLNIALPKGRLGDKVYALFAQAGFSCEEILSESRKLVFEDRQNKVRYFLVKPTDVDIYVEHGAADIGVAGKDVLLESQADVLELMDLKLGRCRFAVAGKPGFQENPALPLRVATKYPGYARRHYASQSRAVEIIKLHGSIELAPLLGLADVIVDIVETGSTIQENKLAILADLAPSSARLIANRASWRFKQDIIRNLLGKLSEIV